MLYLRRGSFLLKKKPQAQSGGRSLWQTSNEEKVVIKDDHLLSDLANSGHISYQSLGRRSFLVILLFVNFSIDGASLINLSSGILFLSFHSYTEGFFIPSILATVGAPPSISINSFAVFIF